MIDLTDPPRVLTAHEVAELWRCSVDHVWAMVRAETCPVRPLRLGRQLRFSTAEVLRGLGVEA